MLIGRIVSFALLIIPMIAFAQSSPTGLGGVAYNLMSPVIVVSDFVHSACLVVGGMFLFASIVKYKEHRRSPTMVPMSTIVFLVIAGIVLVCLPLISFVVSSGIPYTILE